MRIRNRNFRVYNNIYIYIYEGISRIINYIYNWVELGPSLGRVFTKTRTQPRLDSGFFFKYPNPTLFLIRLGKIQSIRVGLGWVPTGRVEIVIPIGK